MGDRELIDACKQFDVSLSCRVAIAGESEDVGRLQHLGFLKGQGQRMPCALRAKVAGARFLLCTVQVPCLTWCRRFRSAGTGSSSSEPHGTYDIPGLRVS